MTTSVIERRRGARSRVIHVSAEKLTLIRWIQERGHAQVLKGWTGTDEEAIAALEADTRQWFVLDAACDAQDESGRCLGHERCR